MKELSKQFIKNMGILNDNDLKKIQEINVLVVGLGGLGGHIVNGLTRLGVKRLILVDYDQFQISNLNRQLFSNHETINQSKASVVKRELLKINPNINISTYAKKIQELNIEQTENISLIVDAVDNINTKLYLQALSIQLDIPLLHGACGGWYGQVSMIKSDRSILGKIYQSNREGLEKELMNPYFAPSITASYMLSEFIKWIKNISYKYNQVILIDLYNNDIEIIDMCGDFHG